MEDGKPNLEVRLGGIYALERIARDSPRDHWTIMEVLTAYVRENARWTECASRAPDGTDSCSAAASLKQLQDAEERKQPRDRDIEERWPVRADIQAVLTVIGRRRRSGDRQEPTGLDLHGADLRGTQLRLAHLEQAALVGTHLERANLWSAHLDWANLWGAHLERADLMHAHLEQAKGLTQEQVYSARNHGEGAFLPPDWPANWRDRFEKTTGQAPVTPSPPAG
ncbi:MAG: pentapeptide repeat-containing protein [Chloroflexi bacterium]|nr:pentapeptide repeat-containing protein [Chloroflexota bacterium]